MECTAQEFFCGELKLGFMDFCSARSKFGSSSFSTLTKYLHIRIGCPSTGQGRWTTKCATTIWRRGSFKHQMWHCASEGPRRDVHLDLRGPSDGPVPPSVLYHADSTASRPRRDQCFAVMASLGKEFPLRFCFAHLSNTHEVCLRHRCRCRVGAGCLMPVLIRNE